MNRLEGGAILPIADYWLGSSKHGHTSELPGRPISQIDLDATNTMQGTDWRINRRLLDVAQMAWVLGHPSIEVDGAVAPVVPDRLDADVFAALDQEGKQVVIADRSEALEARLVWRSKVSATGALLEAAQADRIHPRLWMAWGHDARLRRYPRVTSGPSPQGSGLSRALLEFGTGKRLGSRGLFWLAARAATCAGLDKITHQSRAQWADAHVEDIRACAREPLLHDWWWVGRSDPWGLLATCFELNDALSLADPSSYQSHLAVQVDGTNNGLQHLSALGLDEIGAAATNLTSNSQRRDIYADVAERVSELLDDGIMQGSDQAKLWVGRVTRDVAKRSVMTTPYGVTSRGIRDQLLSATNFTVPGANRNERRLAADYLRDLLVNAIGEVAQGARTIMTWLQTIARELASVNLPLRWQTPSGSTIQQAYRPLSVTRPLTAYGHVVVAAEFDQSSVKASKQANGASPNIVHSFDASHLALTVNECSRRGVTHFSMIHDSYGCHAADMDVMNTVLREQFVAIYSNDWLEHIYQYCRSYAPDSLQLTPPPARGSFDIKQVLDSPWFFA